MQESPPPNQLPLPQQPPLLLTWKTVPPQPRPSVHSSQIFLELEGPSSKKRRLEHPPPLEESEDLSQNEDEDEEDDEDFYAHIIKLEYERIFSKDKDQ